LKDFIDRGLHKDYDVIGIDEAQFFEDVSYQSIKLFR
jgi:thymidine kinase